MATTTKSRVPFTHDSNVFWSSQAVADMVDLLGQALYESNNAPGNHASQSGGAYGHIVAAIEQAVADEFSQAVVEWINNSRYHWNWGGNASFREDIEVAIANALYEMDRERLEQMDDAYLGDVGLDGYAERDVDNYSVHCGFYRGPSGVQRFAVKDSYGDAEFLSDHQFENMVIEATKRQILKRNPQGDPSVYFAAVLVERMAY